MISLYPSVLRAGVRDFNCPVSLVAAPEVVLIAGEEDSRASLERAKGM
jgi:hypothetical protein